MGVEFYAVAPSPGSPKEFFLKWDGWRMIRNLLAELGIRAEDDMEIGEDADLVPAEAAEEWGRALAEALDSIRVIETPDEVYWEGIRKEFTLAGTELADESPGQVRPLNEAERGWVGECAQFFIASAGVEIT